MNIFSDRNLTPVQRKILKTVYLSPGITRSELAALAGISEKSAIRYVSDFLNERLLIVTETRSAGVGRSSELLGLNPKLFTVLALDIGGYSSKAGIVDLSGKVLKKRVWQKDELLKSGTPIMETLKNGLFELINESGENPIGLGIGISGMIDRRENIIYYCPNVPGVINVDTSETFGKELGIPVFLDTSARCLALAEQRYGGHGNSDNMIYLSVGYSIGAGIIADGKMFRGADSKAGELGHTKCTESDERCTCGSTGCLELYATLPMMIRTIKNELDQKKFIFSSLRTLLKNNEKPTVEQVTKAYEMHDRFVTDAMEDAGKKLGNALGYYISAFNPSLVVFGGSMAEFFPNVIDETIREIMRTVLPAALMHTEMKLSKLDPTDAAIKGAAIQVQNSLFGL